MTNETVYQAYFETDKYSVFIEYEPGPEGAIFIVSVSIEPRPVSLFQIRGAKPRRGLVLDEQEEHAEAMLPYTRLEK